MTEVKGKLETLNTLRNMLNDRATAQGWRKADGHLSKAGNRAAVEFLIGAAAATEALGLGKSHNLLGIAFLASVRGADDFMTG